MDLPLRIAAPSASHFKQNASSPTAVQHCLATAFVKSSSKLEGKKIIFLHCFCPTPDMSTQILFLCSERSCSGPQHSGGIQQCFLASSQVQDRQQPRFSREGNPRHTSRTDYNPYHQTPSSLLAFPPSFNYHQAAPHQECHMQLARRKKERNTTTFTMPEHPSMLLTQYICI